jgi:uncharacterized membrane protein
MSIDYTARSLCKSITWRMVSLCLTFLISYWVTGSARLATSISLMDLGAKFIVYYFHERIWTRISWGKLHLKHHAAEDDEPVR